MTTNPIKICVAAIAALAIAALSNSVGADEPVDRVVSALLKAHNRERRLKELSPLTLSPKLCEAARIHAGDMASHMMVGHTGTDGSAPIDRIKRVGYVPARAGENCAEGQWTVGEVMKGWMKSPGHKANIMAAKYTEIGAAWARDEQGTIYWCVDFGTPRFRAARTPSKPDDIAEALVRQINRDRRASRMVILEPDPTLTRAAMALSAAMAKNDSLDMDGDPGGHIDKEVIKGRNIRIKRCARVKTVAAAATELHRDDVEHLHAFREIGVGYAVASSGTSYWCALFASPAELEPATVPASPDR